MTVSSRSLKSPGMIIAGLSALSLGIVGFGLYLMLGTGSAAPPEEVAAVVEPVKERNITALGRIEPAGGVVTVAGPTSPMSSVRVKGLEVAQGNIVSAGDRLAVMDSYEERLAALFQAEAQVREAQINLEQVKAGSKESDIQAQVESARASEIQVNAKQAEVLAKAANLELIAAQLEKARVDLLRYTALQQEGAISQADLEVHQLAFNTKQKELNQAEMLLQQTVGQRDAEVALTKQAGEQISSLQTVRPEDIQRAEAAVLSARANMERVLAELKQSIVVAPMDGQVLKVHAQPGEAVGDEGILDLGNTGQMAVVAEVYETDISKVLVGQLARIKSPALDKELRGRVVQVGLQIDKKDVLDADPAADTDARVVEVTILLEDSAPVASLTNLQVTVAIDLEAPRMNLSPPQASGAENSEGTEADSAASPEASFSEAPSSSAAPSSSPLNGSLLNSPLLGEEPSSVDGADALTPEVGQ